VYPLATNWRAVVGGAASDDERYRIAATAEGGIWLLRTPRSAPVVELAGTRARPNPRASREGRNYVSVA
jgi:hypothetical protein